MCAARYDSLLETSAQVELRLAFQPVLDIDSSTVKMWQALVQDAHGHSFDRLLGTCPPHARPALLRNRTLVVVRAAVGAGLLRTDVQLAVPLHASSDDPDGVATDLLQAAMAHGIPVERLVAELSADEQGHVAATIDLAKACKARGIAVALDGFTAGPAGMKLLGGCRPVYLRVASAMIRNLQTSASRMHMMASVLRLCRSMGVGVIAPDIRDAAESAELHGLGIVLMQGEWIARARIFSVPHASHAECNHAPRREPRPGVAGLTRIDLAASHRRLAHHVRTAQIAQPPAR